MPRTEDPKKMKIIKDMFSKYKRINLYQLGKECNCAAGALSSIIEKMLNNNEIYEEYVTENGVTKRYLSATPFPKNETIDKVAIQKPSFIENLDDIPKFIQNIIGYYQKIENTFSIIKNSDEKNYQSAWKIILTVLADIYKISYNEDEINSKLTMDFAIFQKSISDLVEYLKKIVGDNK